MTTKKLLSICLITFFLLPLSSLIACDVASSPFCWVTEEAAPDSPIFLAKVVDEGFDWRDIEILEVLRGAESRDMVRIWDGPVAWCNGPFFAPASAYGNVGDSIICIADLRIVTDTFSVPLLDYYHTPVLEGVVSLIIENGMVNTLIYDFSTQVQMPYTAFLNSENNWSSCPKSEQAIQESELYELVLFPNPATNYIEVLTTSANLQEVNIYSIDGRKLASHDGNTKRIPLHDFSSGMLLIELRTREGNSIVRKIHKG